MRQVAATPLKAIRKNREAIDEDEQELGVLEELKQHILESALELEKQRQELYHRETPTASNRQGKPGV